VVAAGVVGRRWSGSEVRDGGGFGGEAPGRRRDDERATPTLIPNVTSLRWRGIAGDLRTAGDRAAGELHAAARTAAPSRTGRNDV
jgi:hypothetical protein